MPSGRYLQRILAPNPGPMTLEGTNTWIIGHPGVAPPVVVDPGPADRHHLRQILDEAAGQLAAIILTHRHHDHSDGVAPLAERAGCPALAADPTFQIGPRALVDGEVITTAGCELTPIATPGHTSDSFSLLLRGSDGQHRLLTGDTVLGRGTSVITHPDGNLEAYLASLQRLTDLVVEHDVIEILPGHGPIITEPGPLLQAYIRHRHERLDQVRSALDAGDRTPAEVVARVYADVDQGLWPAAEQSVAAQLDYLRDR